MSHGFAIFVRYFGVLGAIGELVCALLWVDTHHDDGWVLAAAFAVAVLQFVFAFSYARLIDQTLENTEALRRLQRPGERQTSSKQKSTPSADSRSEASAQEENEPQLLVPIPEPRRPGYVICPRCRVLQKDGGASCVNCGACFPELDLSSPE